MRAVSVEEAVAMIPAGASVMVGGFMGVGTPERLLDEVVASASCSTRRWCPG
jgi:acetate CoA/acetoacetate CoA-transferase alpha subunit